MTTHEHDVLTHPVVRCADELETAVSTMLEVPVDLMTAEDRAAALLKLAKVGEMVGALELRLLAGANDLALSQGARDGGVWIAQHTLTDVGPRQRDLRLAEALSERWHVLGAAVSAGEANRAQARVIVKALDALDAPQVGPEVMGMAEEHLVGLAARFAPKQLRVLGKRILDLVAPEIGELHEARALQAEEERAWETTSLTLRPCGDGRTHLEGFVPDAVAHRLTTYLEAFTSPRHESAVGGGEAGRIPSYRKRGQAFCALLEAMDPKRMPMHGGDATTVVVTMTLDQLRGDLATAGLLTGERITAGEARRLACTASILPMVLGGQDEVLNAGRAQRLHPKGMRKLIRARDKECLADGCQVPAAWCEVHHLVHWCQGGATSVENAGLLCSFHHHRAHDPRFAITRLPTGNFTFHRRT